MNYKAQSYTQTNCVYCNRSLDAHDWTIKDGWTCPKETMNKLQELTKHLTKESTLQDLIPWAEIHRYLPFAISKQNGDSRSHIINESIYAIDTNRGTINPGSTLCRKNGKTVNVFLQSNQYEACNGCLNIARGLAMKHANNE